MKKQLVKNFPNVSANQYVIMQAEISTGIILTNDGNYYNGVGQRFTVFNNIEDAKSFIEKNIKKYPTREFILLNSNNEQVAIVRNDGKMPVNIAEAVSANNINNIEIIKINKKSWFEKIINFFFNKK